MNTQQTAELLRIKNALANFAKESHASSIGVIVRSSTGNYVILDAHRQFSPDPVIMGMMVALNDTLQALVDPEQILQSKK